METIATYLRLTDSDTESLLNLLDNDLGTAIKFTRAQEAAMRAERAIQNTPPDEGGQ